MPRIQNTDNKEEIIRYIWNIFERQGRFKGKCEDCQRDLLRKDAKIHHTKYEGATINDLMIICQSCNLKPENKGLK